MLEQIKNNDLIITENKRLILDYMNNNKKLLNIKIMNLKQFIDNYFGYTDKKALYYLVNKYNYKYDVAKLYLDNFYFIDTLKDELGMNQLINYTFLFKDNIQRIVIIDEDVDSYILDEIKKYDYLILNSSSNYEIPNVYEFKTIEEEVNNVCIKIRQLLDKNVELNHIKLICDKEYELIIRRYFKLYNIPVNIGVKHNIYGLKDVQKFLEELNKSFNVETALKVIKNNDIYNVIVDICNMYQFIKLDKTIVYLIEQELKNASIEDLVYDNAVNVIKLDEIYDNDDYYFVLGFNLNFYPCTFKDEDYLSDKQKERLGIFTSIEKNKLSKLHLINCLKRSSKVYVTYKLKNKNITYYPSILIKDLNMNVKEVLNKDYSHSNSYNQLALADKLDNFIKYNIKDRDLNLLFSNYPHIEYLQYNNKYKKISNDLFNKLINKKLLLSYSSLDNFYHCSYRYFLANILKLNKYEETFMTILGSLYHEILSKAFDEKFDFEKEYNLFLEGKVFTAKEEFFLELLKENLKAVINIIKKQDKNSELNSSLYEQTITIDKSRDLEITFMGIIDKIKYVEINNTKYVAVIDYKTGFLHIDLNNLIYGLSMQLPTYLYLLSNFYGQNIKIAGFYLQKIIHEKLTYQLNKNIEYEQEKLYRLEGYSNDDISILEKFDKTYENSKMIKSLKMSSKGFYQYSKVLTSKEINNIINLVDKNIENAIDVILSRDFAINPKRIDNKNIGCEFCKFREICFYKEEDLVDFPKANYKEFLKEKEEV